MASILSESKSFLIVTVMSCLLAACGSGGGGSKDTQNPPGSRVDLPSLSATVSWSIPEARENGESLLLSEIGGYELSYKAEGDSLFTSVIIEDPNASRYVLEDLPEGIYEIKIAVFDTDGVFSEYSNTIKTTVDGKS